MTMASAVLSTVSSVPGHVESDPISELARWIPEQIRKRASRFVLAQRVGDSAHHTVDEWTTAELTDANALAEVIYGTAVRDAQALKTSLAYGVFALRDDRRNQSAACTCASTRGRDGCNRATRPTSAA